MPTEQDDAPKPSEAWQEAITQRIINDLQEGCPTWCKPWRTDRSATSVALPHNASTGRLYSGANVLQLWCVAMEMGYRSHGWMTFKQAQKIGARVRKGQKGTQVIFVDYVEKKEAEGTEKPKRIPFLKVSNSFNLDQLDNVPVTYIQPERMLPESEYRLEATRYAKDSRVERIHYGSDKAAYYPAGDCITMPHLSDFISDDAFAGTLMHELTHAGGHPKRCNRKYGSRFGDEDSYKQRAFEELVAELGSAFFCAHLGIPPTTRTNAGYIKSWLEVLNNDHRAIVSAASYASQTFTFMDNAVNETRSVLSTIAAE